MKNIVRAFALSLVALGAIASIHTTADAQIKHASIMSASPVPQCTPGDTSCGF